MSTQAVETPWSLVGRGPWSWEVGPGRGTVVGTFETVTELTDGAQLLSGAVVDDYGWTHRPASLLFDEREARGLAPAPALTAPEPAPFPVVLGFDDYGRRGCLRLQVPDEVARRLVAWKREHWTEIVGAAYGYTSSARAGTWEHRAMSYLHSIQSHLAPDGHRRTYPIIEGVGFGGSKDHHGNGADYGLLVTTGGVDTDPSNPTRGLHFSG